MTARTLNLDDDLYQYLLDVSLRETPLLKRLRDETQALPMALCVTISPKTEASTAQRLVPVMAATSAIMPPPDSSSPSSERRKAGLASGSKAVPRSSGFSA